MARATGGVEGARFAAGWSLEQGRKMQGTRPPSHVTLPLYKTLKCTKCTFTNRPSSQNLTCAFVHLSVCVFNRINSKDAEETQHKQFNRKYVCLCMCLCPYSTQI